MKSWVLPAALLALLPKCVLCVLAYAGTGAIFGLGGPELCGDTDPEQPWAMMLPLLAALLFAAWGLSRRGRMAVPFPTGLTIGGLKPARTDGNFSAAANPPDASAPP